MDPVTHALLGSAIGYAAFGRRLGRTAAVAGALAALIPDADTFIRSARDPLLEIEYHRHFTHALAFAPLGSAIAATLWFWSSRWRKEWLSLWLCCLAAYVSHCLLDSATTYGTQLFWPFTRYRVWLDWISIIDPAFTVPLAIGVIWAVVVKRTRPAFFALLFAAAYMGWGIVQHARAVSAQRDLASQRGHVIQRFEVMPTLANNMIWRALYLHDGKMYSDRIRVGWFSKPSVAEGLALPVVTAGDLTPAEQERNKHRSFERFEWFSEGWIARQPESPDVLGDMRYSLSTRAFDPIWGIRFTAPNAQTEVEWVNRTRNRRIALGELWNEIRGRDPRYQPF
jgi:inner membrane protein